MKVVLREGVPAAVREQRRKNRAKWEPFPSLQKFLADYYPEAWDRIRYCRFASRYFEAQDGSGRHKVIPQSCHVLPFCIACSDTAVRRRVNDTLDKFSLCTPAGAQPRFIHIVNTAPIYYRESGRAGWGWEASEDSARLGRIVWQTLKELYGNGIGAKMSYQDFGERAFAKRYPHMDLTLNGWQMQDNQATHTPEYDLKNGGHKRWLDALTGHAAAAFRVDAEPGTLYLGRPITGIRHYYQVLHYQMREMNDLRKLDYRPREGTVYWHSYKHNKRERMTIDQFVYGLDEYEKRLAPWSRRQLHRGYGHMADRSVQKTARAIGGTKVPHSNNCPCSKCGDWARVDLREIDQELGLDLRNGGWNR